MHIRIFAYFIVFFFSSVALNALAQSIAVIDLKKVAAKSEAGKGIEQQVAKKNSQSKDELTDFEKRIKSMESSKLSESDPRKVEELQLILYDMVKERRFQISEAYHNAVKALEKIIKDVVKEIASEKGIDIVLASDAVFFSKKNCVDITAEAIERINLKCRHIELIEKEKAKND